jgi:uncharacterized protein
VFRIKRYNQGKERLLAACDEEVLGRNLKEGKLRLNVTPEFYDGFEAGEDELESQLRTCTIANLVGEHCVEVAIRLGFVARENVIRIEGVPHAQWALFF